MSVVALVLELFYEDATNADAQAKPEQLRPFSLCSNMTIFCNSVLATVMNFAVVCLKSSIRAGD